MLVFDPRKRVTAEEALKHPYLHDVHVHWPKTKNMAKFDFSFEKVHHELNRDRVIPKRDLQYLFLYEVNKYRPVQCRIPTPLYHKKPKAVASTSTSSVSAQVLNLRSSRSNQELPSLPSIGGVEQGAGTTEKKDKQKVTRGNVIMVHKKGGISDNAARFFRKVQPASVVPAGIVKKDKLSQSLKPADSHKLKMLGKSGKKSASSNAILRRQTTGAVQSQSKKPKPRRQNLIRRASRNLF